MLRFYIEVARTAFRRQLIYRWANVAGLITNIVFGIIFATISVAIVALIIVLMLDLRMGEAVNAVACAGWRRRLG